MNAPRRADSRAVPHTATTLLRISVIALGTVLAGVTSALAFLSVTMARRVLRPAARTTDTTILAVDTSAQTITLSRTPDTELPGRYGLFTQGSESYVKLGTVLAADTTSVKRKLLTEVAPDAQLSSRAAFSGWYFDSPDQVRVAYRDELIGTSVGPSPAWAFDAPYADTWVIQIHGRGTTRAECLRAVPVFHDAGISSLLVSYRNDGEAPRSRAGAYALGATEWRDVDSAIGFLRRKGVRRIVLMGWSMGGAIALQVAVNSAHRDLIRGIILESPVIDWRTVLGHQARMHRIPAPVADLTIGTLSHPWATRATGGDLAIPFDRLDMVARSAELRQPMLLLHSDDDGFVPSDASHLLAQARPDLVEMHTFATARHTKLWNFDQQRWTSAISQWLRSQDLSSSPQEATTD